MPVPVTEAEKKSPLYKYFLLDMATPPAENYKMAETPLDPARAHRAQDLNKLFDEGYMYGEIGYTQFEDGTTMLANYLPMPGVTPEMFDWWFAWHGLEPLRYKIWNHDEHHQAITRNPDKARDTSLSMKERYWDTIHDVKEAMTPDKPALEIIIHFRNPADIGFDKAKLESFGGSIVCSGDEHAPVIMAHFIRPTAEGSELRTRFWFGWGVRDGKPVKILPDGAKIPPEGVKELLLHNIKEFSNLAAILPKVYAEFKDQF